MPQMAPLSWLLMFIIFSMIFIMFNIMNYYIFLYPTKEKKLNKKMINLIWKW
uniref:ATP synthase complex subunit 8 n=1 Tax=Phalacridae gen. sp. MJ-2020 TaxID=2762523 RepID=A0A7G7MU47_9CUCU|nr:ATP synthase F0 subunit 8 [Phalacridae gen. sp. MJ-2020]